MMGFKDASWSHRYGQMGDEAEDRFERWAHKASVKTERYGLHRPRINMSRLPAFLRHTPDFILHDRLVEAKGVGQDGLVKLKEEQLGAWEFWYQHYPVWLFVWDSHRHREWFGEVTKPRIKWFRSCPEGVFEDNGKVYYEVNVEELWALE